MDRSTAVADATLTRLPPTALGDWHYTRTFFLLGVYRVFERTRDERYLAYVREWVDLALPTARHEDLDSMLGGRLLLRLHRDTGDDRYRDGADRIIARLSTYPRTEDGGFWHKVPYTRQLWADGAYMVNPFLAEYSQPSTVDEAARQIEVYAGHLQLEGGLIRHGYDESRASAWADPQTGVSPEVWGRAVGWFGMALVDVLAVLAADHPRRPALEKILGALLDGVAAAQDPRTGLWYQVLDKRTEPDNWPETSCSAMLTYVASRMGRKTVAAQGFAGVVAQLDGDHLAGTVTGAAPGFYPYYVARPRATDDLHGLGAFLIMNEQILEG